MLPVILVCIALLSPSAFSGTNNKYKFETLLQRKDVIWGFDFLPGGRIILTERGGKMVIFDPASKTTHEVTGVPKVYTAGQAGLLDVRVHPEFQKNGLLYFTYSEAVGEDESTTALGLAKLNGFELRDFKKIFSAHAANDNDIHYGSRIEFDQKGHIFISIGDRDERNRAQDPAFHQGKIIRLNMDGTIPKDNPFFNVANKKPEIWSLGHRSPQGLALHPVSAELWEAEMGPRGGDEVNIIEAWKNYGWPLITYGKEYYGPKIGQTHKEGLVQPLKYWVPSISPSAMTFYTGDKIPKWKNNLFLATLSGTHVHRLVIEGKKIMQEEELLSDLNYRFRSVRTGPDGYLYLGTDEGRFGRLMMK